MWKKKEKENKNLSKKEFINKIKGKLKNIKMNEYKSKKMKKIWEICLKILYCKNIW